MAILDMVGVASIMPLMALLIEPEVVESNRYLNIIYKQFGFKNIESFQIFAGLTVFLLLIISMAFKALTTYMQLRFTMAREYSISRRLVLGYLSQPYTWFLSRNSADLGKAILSEVKEVIDTAMNPIMTLIAQSAVTIALIFLLLSINPYIAAIAAITLASAYMLIFLTTKEYLGRIGQARFEANRQRFSAISEAFGAFKEIKLGQHEKTYLHRFSKPAEVYAKHQATSSVIGQLPRYALEGVAFGGLIMLMLILLLTEGDLKSALPVITVYAFAGYRLLPALQQIYSASTQLRFAAPALDSIFSDFVNLKEPPEKLDDEQIRLQDMIELKEISYNFPEAPQPVLRNLTLTIPAKTTIGFVGATGSGKTTTVDLLLGLLTPTSGKLLVDGKELKPSDMSAWQASIGYVTQNIYLTDDTITANIAFGVSAENIDYTAVQRAAKLAKLDEFVENLPDKYETVVGERGVRLSGGQRQRIGIARAVYNNPRILIMDEATSALDNITEQKVMEAINGLASEMTIILIAHRLSTVKACEKIFMLDNGTLRAEGTYTQLLEGSPEFRALANAKS